MSTDFYFISSPLLFIYFDYNFNHNAFVNSTLTSQFLTVLLKKNLSNLTITINMSSFSFIDNHINFPFRIERNPEKIQLTCLTFIDIDTFYNFRFISIFILIIREQYIQLGDDIIHNTLRLWMMIHMHDLAPHFTSTDELIAHTKTVKNVTCLVVIFNELLCCALCCVLLKNIWWRWFSV